MKTIVVANQKGGVGKTAILVHLAHYMADIGKKTVVIDLDHQMNATYSLQGYAKHPISQCLRQTAQLDLQHAANTLMLLGADTDLIDLDAKTIATVTAGLKAVVEALERSGTDIVLIDTAPALGVRLASALLVADFVLSPIELEVYSLQGISLMLQTIDNIKAHNKKLRFLGMLPSRVDNRNPRHPAHLRELEKEYKELLMPCNISQRSSVADALASRQPVWKIKKTSARLAAREMRNLGEYVAQQITGA